MTKERAKIKAAKYLEWALAAESKSAELTKHWYAQYGNFDWTQPILRGHHSQRRHERIYEHRDAYYTKLNELEAKAKSHREKAENLMLFANRNKGDADKRREQEFNASGIVVGSRVYNIVFRYTGTVKRISKKQLSIIVDGSGERFTHIKSAFKLVWSSQ